MEPWDRRICQSATIEDIDLLAFRDTLQRIGLFSASRGIESYLSGDTQLSPFVPPLCGREPLTGEVRPRNFTILLFSRETQRFIPGAFSLFSVYTGIDRSDTYAERYEISGNLLGQARRLTELLDIQSYTAFDKNQEKSPNALKYPKKALYESLGNALAHRDYELDDPTRFTVFSDRIEIRSPGSLPTGVDVNSFRNGLAEPKWRNQALAWFFSRLQLAQAEGQGITTILRVMREEGCPPPIFDADNSRVLCVLPAHPRHALLRDLRTAEQSLTIGDLRAAQEQINQVMAKDPLNFRALQLFAEVQHALRDPGPIEVFLNKYIDQIERLPSEVLLSLAEALTSGNQSSSSSRILSQKLLISASQGRLEERELRRIAVALNRAHNYQDTLALIGRQLQQHPEWERNASLLQLRGDSLLGLATNCRHTGKNIQLLHDTRRRAWRDFHNYIDRAERDLREALLVSNEESLKQLIERNLEYLEKLRRENRPPTSRRPQ